MVTTRPMETQFLDMQCRCRQPASAATVHGDPTESEGTP